MALLFDSFKKTKDIQAYMTELWQRAEKDDTDSLLVLLYLAAQTCAANEAVDFLEKLCAQEEAFSVLLGENIFQQVDSLSEEDKNDDILLGYIIRDQYDKTEKQYLQLHPEYVFPRRLFGDLDLSLRQAYKYRVGRLQVPSPDIKEYRKRNDINGYFTALWQGIEMQDLDSMHVLLYLATQTSETEDALDILEKMQDVDSEYALLFIEQFRKAFNKMSEEDKNDHWKLGDVTKRVHCEIDYIYEHKHPEHLSAFKRFDSDMDIILRRAYCNNVGRQTTPETPADSIVFNDCVPQEKKDYWKGLYSRSDCSSNQESIYNDAIPYAQQGDPYAMYIAGYLLSHGIRTKYSNPNVVILPADKEKALPWLIHAAEGGVTEAYWEVWLINSDESYLRRGAELKDENCIRHMVDYIDDDAAKVEHLTILADEFHSNQARLQLAKHYENGIGCQKNEKKAFELVEYVYNHSSASPYNSSYEDAVDMIYRYFNEGIGCEVNPERASQIQRWFHEDEDRMWELLSR